MANPISCYTTVDVGYPYRLRGAGNTQSSTGLLFPSAADVNLTSVGVNPGTQSATYMEGLGVGDYLVQNRSGATILVGPVGVRIPNRYWIAGTWTDAASTPFTDQTTAAQNATTDDFNLESLTNNDGYVIASRVPFNAVSIHVSTASVGAGAVRALRYTNSAGSGWTTVTNVDVFDGSSGVLSATTTGTHSSEGVLLFRVPVDWGKVQSGGLSGIPVGYYAINVRATTAPATTAAIAQSLSIYRIYDVTANVTNNTSVTWSPGGPEMQLEPLGDALVACFGTASDANRVRVLVRRR